MLSWSAATASLCGELAAEELDQLDKVCLVDAALLLAATAENLPDLRLTLNHQRINAHALAFTAGDGYEDFEVIVFEELLERIECGDLSDISHLIVVIALKSFSSLQVAVSEALPIVIAIDGSLVVH